MVERVLRRIESTPDAPAFISAGKAISYRGLGALLSSTVRFLHGEGVKPGDLVSLTMSQSPLHLVAVLALARLGAVTLSTSLFLRAEERAEVFAKYRVGLVVTDRNDLSSHGARTILLQQMGARGDESRLDFSAHVPAADAPMRLSLTSGTTGTPKAVMHTHASLVARIDRTGFEAGVLPRFIPPNLHITLALTFALYTLFEGGTVVFPRGYDNEPYFDAIRTHAVTHLALPPANLALMLPALPEGHRFASLRHLRLLGVTPSPSFLREVLRRFTPNVYLPYAMGEIGLVSMAGPELLAREPASSGAVAPGARVEVIDEGGRALAPGVTGEIRVAVEGMPGGYYGPDAGDRSRFRDGWFHPNDRGYLSPEGLVFVEGRIDDVLNVGGRKVSPRFIETVLEDFPGVREAAVFAAGEGPEGTRLAAAIVPSGALDWRGLAAYASAQLEVRAPLRYYEAADLPRNSMGKLERKLVSETIFSAAEIRL